MTTKTTSRHSLIEPPAPANLPARLEAVPDTQLPDERPSRGSRLLLIGCIVLALLLGVGVWYLATRGATAEVQRDAEAGQKLDLASQVSQACASGQLPAGDRLCTKAAEVQAAPIPGDVGPAGRGITGTRIESGRLVVSYTDGTVDDVGVVVGAPGAPAAPARGITGSTIEAGQLVVSYTDGTRSSLGPVVGSNGRDGRDGDAGKPGRGVASVGQVDGRLVVTYTDGTTQDVGPLPAGQRGEPAPTVTRQTFTFEDGSKRVCDRVGGTDEAPDYRCGPKQLPADEPSDALLGGGA